MLFGTLEAGGTKMVLSVGSEANELTEQAIMALATGLRSEKTA